MADMPGGEVLVYEASDGGVRVEVRLDCDTVWLTQRQMSELFETTPENVLMHLKKIYASARCSAGSNSSTWMRSSRWTIESIPAGSRLTERRQAIPGRRDLTA